MNNNDFVYKIILIGDIGVGKTFLLKRFVDNKIPTENNFPTIGVEFAKKTIEQNNGAKIRTSIWDTAGQERYRSICQGHYREAAGCLQVYDMTNERTFENCQRWLTDFEMNANKNSKIMLVGNKLDLVEKNPDLRKVSRNKADDFARQRGQDFIETSAVTDENVDEAFLNLQQDIFQENNARDPNSFPGFKLENEGKKEEEKGFADKLGECC